MTEESAPSPRPRVARRAPEDLVPLSVRIPRELHERLAAQAEKRMVGLSYLAGRALAKFLTDLESDELP